MKSSPTRSWLIISSIIILLVTGCGLWSRSVKIGERFTMRPGERVVVAGSGLAIRLEGVGHQTFPDPQPRPLRSSYVELTITGEGAPPRPVTVDDNINVGDYTITVNSADPFRSDGPRCELVVTRR